MSWPSRFLAVLAGLLPFVTVLPRASHAATLPSFDFRSAAVASSWHAQHDISRLESTPEGLAAHISGPDPYFAGPARDYPPGQMLWLNVRLRSDSGGTAQVFYYSSRSGPTEPDSVRFPVPAGVWSTVRVPCPALGASYQLRLDPPGESGLCTYERLWFEERVQFADPPWPVPSVPTVSGGDPSIESGVLRLVHNRTQFGGFVVQVDGTMVAVGQTRPLVGYVVAGKPRWWALGQQVVAELGVGADGIRVGFAAKDPDGATWRWAQHFRAGSTPGTIEVETVVGVDQERSVLYLPPLTLLTGLGAGGGGIHKQQGILAGVEYLDDEPSSSEADLQGAQARRQVTDTERLTFPLAAIVAGGRYVGLSWDMQPGVSVVFDSPDRLFQSGGHLMGLLLPGSDGLNREEGSLVPYDTLTLGAGTSITIRARILGGRGTDAVSAVRHYLSVAGLPAVPETGHSVTSYSRLAAHGWLDTAVRDGDLYRHAVPGSFGSGPAADAAYFADYLAGQVGDEALAARLRSAAAGALSKVATNSRFASGVGHVKSPVAPLVYGAVLENAEAALQQGRSLLGRFPADGTLRYVPAAGSLDYSRTHWTNEANGFTAQTMVGLLQSAAFSGNATLIEGALKNLRAMNKFHGGVPRGAQTWEIPLHTADILASGYLVRCYTLGYQLSGDAQFLDEARYWAWTGVPFVYLRSPTAGPVGPYATTPVLGATQWVAPNWIGLPVQWCGLVYGDALYRLADLDPSGPWRQIADGIALSGVQQTYPVSDAKYGGLLPDSFSLKPQQRNAANINPGTLLASATRRLGSGAVYDLRLFAHHGALVHAPGPIEWVREDKDAFEFRVAGWPSKPWFILVNGLHEAIQVRIDGREVPLVAPHAYFPGAGRLILQVTGTPRIEIRHPARTAMLVRPTGVPGMAQVCWPIAAEGFQLESTSEDWVDGHWSRFDGPIEISGALFSAAISTDGPARWFRLRR